MISLSFIVTLLIGCSSATVRNSASASEKGLTQEEVLQAAHEKNTPDAKEYESMDLQYRKKAYENVLKRSKVFISSYPSSDFLEHVYNLRALAYIALKQPQFALFQLKKTLEISKTESLRNTATYNLAYVYFELGQIEQSFQALDSLKLSSLEKNDRFKVYVLRAKIARLKEDRSGSAEEILQALKNLPEPKSKSTVEPLLNFLDDVLDPINNILVLEKLLNEFEDTVAADRLYYKVGTYYFGSSDRDKSKKYFQKILDDFPESSFYASAKENLRKLEFNGVMDPRRIGVVLTLSGKFGKYGYKALQGIELALKIFNKKTKEISPGTTLSLVVMDDQGDPDRAQMLMDDLYFKHHVAAIIGPLVSKLAEPMGKRAQELGVPLITLTQKEANNGDFVFNAALTPAMQVHELIRYAIGKVGVKNFAILSPNNKFGEEHGKAFWDEIDRNNAFVKGYETYQNEETDFRTYIDRLVGLAQTDARSKEVEELKTLKAATPIKGRSKKFDRMFDLKPMIDFEAVFIPDEPKTLGQILPTFAYRDVEKVLFLGINTWNSAELIARAGQFAEGAVFVDGFYSGSQMPSTKQFIEEYRQVFGSEPGLLEALSYDAANILESILRGTDLRTRAEVRDKIIGLRGFPGVSGKISYLGGRLTKHLNLLTVKGGKIQEIAF